MNELERRLLSLKRPKIGTSAKEAVGELIASHKRVVRNIKDQRDHLNLKALDLMKRHALSLLVDAYSVEREGVTPIGEVLR